MLISDFAEKVGLHPETIRRLERRGVITPKRDVNGWRHYSAAEVEHLKALYVVDDENPERTRAA